MTVVTPMYEGEHLVGEHGESYLTVGPLGPSKPGATSNVWSAVDSDTQEEVYIIKQPSANDTAQGWPLFSSEMIMHELFKDCPYIRQQVDRIPPDGPNKEGNDPPRLVLEPTETTLAMARDSRPMTAEEIKILMRGVLLGLKEIHTRGLVYADLKMENILVNGFRASAEETAEAFLVAKLGDLGIVMSPAYGKVQPVAYRAPEVYFKSLITPAADIWSWGVIYCQLLEAQVKHDELGMYDNLTPGTMQEAEETVQRAIFDDFDLSNIEFYNDCPLPAKDHSISNDEWATRMLKKGAPKDGVAFLSWVLDPDPNQRPSAAAVLRHPWLNINSSASEPENLDNSWADEAVPLPPMAALNEQSKQQSQQPITHEPAFHSEKSVTESTVEQPAQQIQQPQIGDIYIQPLAAVSTASSLAPSPAQSPNLGPTDTPSAAIRPQPKHKLSPSVSDGVADMVQKRPRAAESERPKLELSSKGNTWLQYGGTQEQDPASMLSVPETQQSNETNFFVDTITPMQQQLSISEADANTVPPLRAGGANGFQNPGLMDRLRGRT